MKNFSVDKLVEQIRRKKSFLCVGLDVSLDKIPPHLLAESDPIFAFNKAIIDATYHQAVCYKPNIAFYEAYGLNGWKSLQKTIEYINENYPDIFTIADAKRGDIGNTSTMYAKAFFENLNFDSITISPYMGKDSVQPFLNFPNKATIVLALTSNEGAVDFQFQSVGEQLLYQVVLETSQQWGNSENLMYVVGATKADFLQKIREIVPNHFLLIPGVGVQGGSLSEVCKYGLNSQVGILVNSSRGIIYASSGENFAEKAHQEALKLQQEMQFILENQQNQ